jgi:hypothetical protein
VFAAARARKTNHPKNSLEATDESFSIEVDVALIAIKSRKHHYPLLLSSLFNHGDSIDPQDWP